jgi:hypothetical protein
MSKIIYMNRTLHPVNLLLKSGEIVALEPHPEGPIRLRETVYPVGTLPDGAPLVQVVREEGSLPDERPRVLLIVSDMVRTTFPHRKDLISPHGTVRDTEGRITGCTQWAVNS